MKKRKLKIQSKIGQITIEPETADIIDGICKYCKEDILFINIFDKQYLPVTTKDGEYFHHNIKCEKTTSIIKIKKPRNVSPTINPVT